MEEHPSDPYAFLLTHSKPSTSQEDKLQNCPFAEQSQFFSNSGTQSPCTSSQPVGIIMESPPDSQPNSIEDKYLTPPEHQASDSDKANLDSEWCDCVAKDHATEVKTREFDEIHGPGKEITSKKNIQEKLELVETQETENVDTDIIRLNCDETGENEDIERVNSIDTDFILDSEGYRVEMKLSEDNLENNLDLADKDYREGDGGGKRKVLENVGDCKGVNVVCRDENDLLDGDENGNSSGCCRDVDGVENCGHKDDVDILRSGKSKLRGRKRMLPVSFENGWGNVDVDQRGKDGSVSGEGNVKFSMAGKDFVSEVACGNVGKGNSSFLNLVLKASEFIKGEVDPDYKVDFEEILRMKGIVFPRPRWWPAEGFN